MSYWDWLPRDLQIRISRIALHAELREMTLRLKYGLDVLADCNHSFLFNREPVNTYWGWRDVDMWKATHVHRYLHHEPDGQWIIYYHLPPPI